MNYFTFIEILGSVFYLLQNISLSLEKRIGWLLGLIGAIAYFIVAIHKGSFAYSVLEVMNGIIFIFGIFVWQKYENVERKVTLTMSVLALIGIFFVFFLNLGSPNWILENLMVIVFVLGIVFLVLRNPIGWILYILGHILLIAYAYLLGTYFILILQVVSLPFAFLGYKNFKLKKSRSLNDQF